MKLYEDPRFMGDALKALAAHPFRRPMVLDHLEQLIVERSSCAPVEEAAFDAAIGEICAAMYLTDKQSDAPQKSLKPTRAGGA